MIRATRARAALRPILLALVVSGPAGLGAAAAGAAEPSSGCGMPPPQRPPQSFEVAGRERSALVVLPDDYRADRPHALIFAFHGRTNDNARARRYFELERATDEPTIYVYPAGLLDRTERFTWADPADPPRALRDFALFDVILDGLKSAYCVDLDAVHVVGHSLGASFANSLACARPDQIRGVATVAGGIAPSDCSGEVAALLLHNPRDRAVPVSEGEKARDALLGRPGASVEPVRRRFAGFQCSRYGSEANPILWCLHGQDFTPRGRFYPHQWPRGASEAIVTFFATLPPSASPAGRYATGHTRASGHQPG
jgi:polyhydroxybutyrate depolymerase